MTIEEYTEFLVKSICQNDELIKVTSCQNEKKRLVLDIVIPEPYKGRLIGHQGKTIKAIHTLVNAHAYANKKGYVEINIETF